MKKYIIKYLAIICTIFIFFYSSNAQNSTNEAFDYNNNISDTIKIINNLLQSSNEYVNVNDSIALNLLNYSLKLAYKINYTEGLFNTYNQIINIFEQKNDYEKLKHYLFRDIILRNNYFNDFPDDTSNLNSLINKHIQIAEIYELNYEKNIAVEFYQKAIYYSELNENDTLQEIIYNKVADCYLSNDDYFNAIINYKKSLEISEKYKNAEGIFENTQSLGFAYFSIGEIKTSLDYYFSALDFAEKIENENFIALSNTNISKVFANIGLYEKALFYNEQSLVLLSDLQDTNSLAIAYIRQAEILFETENYENSLEYYFKTIGLLKEKSNQLLLANAYNGIGEVYDKQQNFGEAYKYFLISLSIRSKENSIKDLVNSYNSLGNHYFLIDSLDDAEVFLNKAYILSTQIHNSIEVLEASRSLSELYNRKKEYNKALEFHMIYKNISDSLVNQDIANVIAKIELQRQHEKENLLKDQKITSVKKFRNIFIAGILILLVFSIFILFSYRTIKRKNKALAEKASEIEKQNEIIKLKSEEFEKLAIVASKSENGVVIMDKDANIEWVNYGINKIYNTDEKLINIKVGTNLRNISLNEKINEIIDNCIKNKKSVHYEYSNNDSENPLWLQTTLTPIVENNEVIKIIAVDTDISDIKLAEKQIINQKIELQEQSELLSLYVSQLNAQKVAMIESNEELQQQREELLTQTELLEFTNKKLEKLSIVASKTDNSIYITDPDGTISWVNDAFSLHTGFTLDEFKRKFGDNIKQASSNFEIDEIFNACVNTKKTVIYTSKLITKFGHEKWFQTTLTPILDESNDIIQIVAIDTDITKVKLAEETIAEQNAEIKDSITYASRIQRALLPMDIYIDAIFESYFILNKPRDIVSGDFYWFGSRDDKIIAAVADCTGHGIPGAFMSVLGMMSLNNIVLKLKDLKADEILNILKERVISLLHQTGKEGEASDGMDMALCIIDNKNMTVQYAAGNSPLYIVKSKPDSDGKPVITKYLPDKMPVGYYSGKDESFNEQIIKLDKNDTLYLCSDGFIDQFGGPCNKKFLTKKFQELLRSINYLPMDKRKIMLEKNFEDWKGSNQQVDDILIVGIEIV